MYQRIKLFAERSTGEEHRQGNAFLSNDVCIDSSIREDRGFAGDARRAVFVGVQSLRLPNELPHRKYTRWEGVVLHN
eukprot:gene5215-biopygen13036